MVCSKCGFNVVDNLDKCPNCGNLLNQSGFTKKQKVIVISLLLVVIIFLSITLFLVLPSNKVLKDDTKTIMIYVVGSNLETDSGIVTADLESIKPENIDLEKTNILMYTGGTEKWHNFISNEENAIYLLTADGFEKIETYDQENMGSPDTLSGFLNYAYDNYKAGSYNLILYDHGGALDGAIYDSFSEDHLSLSDFSEALGDSEFNEDNKLDTVLFRTCLNGTIEVANVFSDYANYLIASEEITYGASDSSVLDFFNNLNDVNDSVEYGKQFIASYENQMDDIDPFHMSTYSTYSIVDLSKIDEINELLSEFISGINLNNDYSDIVKVRANMYQYAYDSSSEESYDTVDLYSLIDGLSDYSSVSSDELLETIEEAVVYNWSELENSHGLSIYFPSKGSKSIQASFLKVYDQLELNDEYYDFIYDYATYNTSNKASSFSGNSLLKTETKVSNSKEFSLKLTDEQVNDYATSIYIIFAKEDDEFYTPIYSSDNTILTSDGYLKTNIDNNLIKVKDKSDSKDTGSYLTIIERSKSGKKTISTSALLYALSKEDVSDWKVDSVNVYFDVKNDIPTITNYIKISDDDSGTSAYVIDIDDYSTIDFFNSRYKILDSKGNYTDDWDNDGVSTLLELKLDDVELVSSSLDDEAEYYCVFKIWDVYGNYTYSKLIKVS